MNSVTGLIDLNIIKASCSDCNLSELCLPRGLHREELERLDAIVRRQRPLQRGERVFGEDDAFHAIYAVRSGAVKLYQDTDSGDEQILSFCLPGELFGFDAIHDGYHHCSSIALETSSVCAFPYERLNEISQRSEGLRNQLYRLMSREISDDNRFLLSLKHRTAEQRVAAFLLNLALRYHSRGYSAREYKLPMSREEIGNYLGLTTETVSRIISRMQRDNIIETRHRFVTIHQTDELRSLCGDPPSCSDSLASFDKLGDGHS